MAKQRTAQADHAQQAWPKVNPALKALDKLAGEWEMRVSNAAFLPSGIEAPKGYTSFRWLEDRAFMEMRQGTPNSGAPTAVCLIGRDEANAEYRLLYYDSRGVSRIYRMTFDGSVWKLWRDATGFSQRFEGRLAKDGKSMHAAWEKSTDGKTWEHDFDLDYKRIDH